MNWKLLAGLVCILSLGFLLSPSHHDSVGPSITSQSALCGQEPLVLEKDGSGMPLPPAGNADDVMAASGLNLICPSDGKCSSFSELMQCLRDPTRPNPEFRILQARNGQDALAPRHPQYSKACGFFSIAAIVEYLGYAHYVPGGHYNVTFDYMLHDGTMLTELLDVGYYNSVEHLIATYIDADSESYGQAHYGEEGFLNSSDRLTATDLSRDDRACSTYFDVGHAYGLCDPCAGASFDSWICAIGIGCDGPTTADCECAWDATCGLFWFLNHVLQERNSAGCYDALRIKPDTQGEVDDARRIIRAFVDNDVPLLASVKKGGHFVVIIGYADIDAAGLPATVIVADPVFHAESPENVYWLIEGVDELGNWNQSTANTGDPLSLRSIIPWNQHLNGGCEEGGWAYELDASLTSPDFRICPLPASAAANCRIPFVGITVLASDDGQLKREWHTYIEGPFITESGNVDADTLVVRFYDGVRSIASAVAKRYWCDDQGNWKGPMTFVADAVAQRGKSSSATWDGSWVDDHWIVAEGLSGEFSKRRTTIELTLDTGENLFVEVSPPGTYGIRVRVHDDGEIVHEYFVEAGQDEFDGTSFLLDASDRSCDAIEMEVSLGHGIAVSSAAVQRWGYSTNSGAWSQITPTWSPDVATTLPRGLSGTTWSFSWNDAWPENYWLTADNVGDDSADRKTMFILNMEGGEPHEVQIVPY